MLRQPCTVAVSGWEPLRVRARTGWYPTVPNYDGSWTEWANLVKATIAK